MPEAGQCACIVECRLPETSSDLSTASDKDGWMDGWMDGGMCTRAHMYVFVCVWQRELVNIESRVPML